MADEIIQLRAGDCEELIAYLNRAFQKKEPDIFENLLPMLYRPTERHMAWEYAIRRQGCIAAVVGVAPIEWQVGDEVLRVAGIGGVSVAPEHRRQGLMRRLMTHCAGRIQEEGYDLSFLGGQRQRYGYFGYERTGPRLTYHVNQANMRHRFPGDPPLLHLQRVAADDDAAVAWMHDLHDRQRLRCRRRPEEFHGLLRSWLVEPWLARDARAAPVGYLSGDIRSGRVNELVSVDASAGLEMIRAWVSAAEQPAAVECAPVPSQFGRDLATVAEQTTITALGNCRVLNWCGALHALLRLRHEAEALPAGDAVIRITGQRAALRMVVGTDGARCVPCRAEPDLETDACTMMRVLFGPTPPTWVTSVPPRAAVLSAWCPLPLWIPPQDHV